MFWPYNVTLLFSQHVLSGPSVIAMQSGGNRLLIEWWQSAENSSMKTFVAIKVSISVALSVSWYLDNTLLGYDRT